MRWPWSSRYADLGVHHADDIHHGRLAGAFVMDQAGRVGLADPGGHGVVVGAETGFVAQRPDDDRGVVLVALDHALGPVDVGGLPVLVIRQPVQVAGQAKTVAFQVGFVDHVQAVAVAQVQPARIVGIVRGAHGVDVVLLHQGDVLHHRFVGHGVAQVGVRLVAVDALQLDRHAVEQKHAARGFRCGGSPRKSAALPARCRPAVERVSSSEYR